MWLSELYLDQKELHLEGTLQEGIPVEHFVLVEFGHKDGLDSCVKCCNMVLERLDVLKVGGCARIFFCFCQDAADSVCCIQQWPKRGQAERRAGHV